MSDVKGRLEELRIKKQDIAGAVSLDDVGTAVSRAIDHADRRADNVIMSIAGEIPKIVHSFYLFGCEG